MYSGVGAGLIFEPEYWEANPAVASAAYGLPVPAVTVTFIDDGGDGITVLLPMNEATELARRLVRSVEAATVVFPNPRLN